jgi:hypothetical protein
MAGLYEQVEDLFDWSKPILLSVYFDIFSDMLALYEGIGSLADRSP